MGRRLATQWRSLADNGTCSNLRVTSSPERSKPIEEVWPTHSGWTVPFTTDLDRKRIRQDGQTSVGEILHRTSATPSGETIRYDEILPSTRAVYPASCSGHLDSLLDAKNASTA